MRKTALLLVACIGLAGTNVSPGFAPQDQDEFNRVEQAVRAAIGWAKDKDLKLLYETIANTAELPLPGGPVEKERRKAG